MRQTYGVRLDKKANGRSDRITVRRTGRSSVRSSGAVKKAVSFYQRTTKRSDVDAIMKDLAKL